MWSWLGVVGVFGKSREYTEEDLEAALLNAFLIFSYQKCWWARQKVSCPSRSSPALSSCLRMQVSSHLLRIFWCISLCIAFRTCMNVAFCVGICTGRSNHSCFKCKACSWWEAYSGISFWSVSVSFCGGGQCRQRMCLCLFICMSSVNYLFTAVPVFHTEWSFFSDVFFLCGDCSSFCHVENASPPFLVCLLTIWYFLALKISLIFLSVISPFPLWSGYCVLLNMVTCSKVINTFIHSSVFKIVFVSFVGLGIWFSIRTEARL